MNARILASPVVITLLLAGCGGPQGPEAELDRSSAQATVTPTEGVQPPTIASLAKTASLGPGVLSRVEAGELDQVEAPIHCSMDSANGANLAVATIGTGGPLHVSGWIETGGEAPPTVAVVLRGLETYAFSATLKADRPDVAKIVSVAHVSDVVAATTLIGVTPGAYSIYFVRSDDAGLAKCIANSKIQVK